MHKKGCGAVAGLAGPCFVAMEEANNKAATYSNCTLFGQAIGIMVMDKDNNSRSKGRV